MKKIAFMLCCLALILGGCHKARIVDELLIVHAMGYDVTDGKYIGTAIYPTFKQGPMTKPDILTTNSATIYDLIPRLSAKSALPIEEGQLRMVVFGKEFAKRGVTEIVHSLSRNNKVGSRLQLGVAAGSAEEILRITAKTTVSDTLYLSNLVEQNIETMNLPQTNLHLFMYNYYAKGRDPYLPYLKKQGNFVKLEGLALFKKDKYVGSVNLRNSFFVKLLLNETKNGVFQVKISNKGEDEKANQRVLLQNLYGEADYSLSQKDGREIVKIDIKIRGLVRDYPVSVNMSDPDSQKKITRAMEKEVEREIKDLIKYFQEKEIDPLGIGDFVRSKTRNWNEDEFYKKYKAVAIRPEVSIEIVQTGIAE